MPKIGLKIVALLKTVQEAKKITSKTWKFQLKNLMLYCDQIQIKI